MQTVRLHDRLYRTLKSLTFQGQCGIISATMLDALLGTAASVKGILAKEILLFLPETR